MFIDDEKILKTSLRKLLLLISIIIIFIFSIRTKIKIEIRNNEAAIISSLIDENPEMEREIIKTFFKDKGKEDIEKGKKIFNKYSYNLDSNYMESYNNINKYIIRSGGLLVLIISLLYLTSIAYEKMRIRHYIRQIDKFIDSVLNKNFDINMSELDGSLKSKLNSRFNKLGVAIEKNYERLERDNDYIRDSLADISHQIKTPLASISMYNEILLNEDNLSEDAKIFLESSTQQVNRLRWLTDSLLKLSKIEANAITFKKERFPISNLSLDFERVLYNSLKTNDLTIREEGDCEALVDLDYNWTREALLNIVKNATEHAYRGTEIVIKYTSNVSMLRVDVINEGEDIPLEDLSNLFIRFYKSSKNTNPESVGIGLNLSKEIIERQKGTISVQSNENQVIFSLLFLK